MMRRATGARAVAHRDGDVAGRQRRVAAGEDAGNAGFAHAVGLMNGPLGPSSNSQPSNAASGLAMRVRGWVNNPRA